MIIIVIQFMFLDVSRFWALLTAHFNPRLMARAKMGLSRAQNILMPANIRQDFFRGWRVTGQMDFTLKILSFKDKKRKEKWKPLKKKVQKMKECYFSLRKIYLFSRNRHFVHLN